MTRVSTSDVEHTDIKALTPAARERPTLSAEATIYSALIQQASFHASTNGIYCGIMSTPAPTAAETLKLDEARLGPHGMVRFASAVLPPTAFQTIRTGSALLSTRSFGGIATFGSSFICERSLSVLSRGCRCGRTNRIPRLKWNVPGFAGQALETRSAASTSSQCPALEQVASSVGTLCESQTKRAGGRTCD
jgi:hypothetical protein